jgi:hypothetical protein
MDEPIFEGVAFAEQYVTASRERHLLAPSVIAERVARLHKLPPCHS